MAEMYGELMEFNDRLHKRVLAKDFIIVKLCQTLMLAGIDVSFNFNHEQIKHLISTCLFILYI